MREKIIFVVITVLLSGLGCSSMELGGLPFADIFRGKAEKEKVPEPTAEGAETKIIRSIYFVGNRFYTDKTLQKKLGFRVGDRVDAVLAEAYRSTLSEFYRRKGFAFAGVTLDGERLKNGQVIYTIDEGPRVRIASVRFSGNRAIKTSALKKAIKTETRKWVVMPRYYIKEEVAEDVERLKVIYYERGFLNHFIRAQPPEQIRFSEDKSMAYITFAIDEGPVYNIRDIIFTGNENLDEETLLAGLKLKNGQAYNRRLADLHARHIASLYRGRGFIDAKAEQRPQFIADVNFVNVIFDITEGNQFRIGRIDVTGNQQTQDKVVRRVLDEYDFTPGQFYNANIAPRDGGGRLESLVQRMVMAEEVIIRPVEPESGASDQKDVRVGIKEGRTGMIMIGGAVSSDAEVIGQLVYNQRNFDIMDWPDSFSEFVTGKAFKGAGQSLRIAIEPGTEVTQYSIAFTEPYFRDKPIALDVVGSSWSRWRESYDEERTKGFVGFEKRYKNRWRRSIGLRCESVKVGSVSTYAPVEIVDVEGDNALVGVILGFGRDLRDDRYNPSRGRWFDASYEQVTGSETFGILSGTYRLYKTLHEDLAGRKTVLAMKLLGGSIVGDAQPFEKFYAGGTGAYGIRGFRYRGVSTRGLQTNLPPGETPERKDPIGSDYIFLANAEVTVPLFSESFGALFFIDSGTIDTGGYRASAGTGIQIMIPQWFGPVPMRFELAAPFMKDEDDETRSFSFSVGRLF